MKFPCIVLWYGWACSFLALLLCRNECNFIWLLWPPLCLRNADDFNNFNNFNKKLEVGFSRGREYSSFCGYNMLIIIFTVRMDYVVKRQGVF